MAGKQEKEKLDWVLLQESSYDVESSSEKFVRKLGDNPLVPIGCLATVVALSFGLFNFYKGNKQMQQYMMRARVAAQSFTIIAMIAGLGLAASKE
ncbi:HIG1 domain family member 2A, mitochondrial [Orussus abietinus]|uniref:HIG1 domain family member 2A, mitochondrial n=1 Tax=Orussus abietinus TaxID=222816 RepID=UPI000625BF01|nr:HIG1 domain family member 2A, mitochondrial [Orussus abietinus]